MTVGHEVAVAFPDYWLYHYMVNGDVKNLGGSLRHFGSLNGKMFELTGTAYIDAKAVICPYPLTS